MVLIRTILIFSELLMDTSNLYPAIDTLDLPQQHSSNNMQQQTAEGTWRSFNGNSRSFYGNNLSVVSASGVQVNSIYGLGGYSSLEHNQAQISPTGSGYLHFVPTRPPGETTGSFLRTSQYTYRI